MRTLNPQQFDTLADADVVLSRLITSADGDAKLIARRARAALRELLLLTEPTTTVQLRESWRTRNNKKGR